MCPEPIDIRFCYDFRIIDFLIKNSNKLEDLDIPFYFYCYGVILEVLWDLYTALEKRSTTIATALLCILNTINELKKIAHLTECLCLRNNCYRVINIINEKLSAEFVLARTAFSLTVDGRNYYHGFAFGDRHEIELFKSYEAQHQRIKNYFVYSLAPVLFPHQLTNPALIQTMKKKKKKKN